MKSKNSNVQEIKNVPSPEDPKTDGHSKIPDDY